MKGDGERLLQFDLILRCKQSGEEWPFGSVLANNPQATLEGVIDLMSNLVVDLAKEEE